MGSLRDSPSPISPEIALERGEVLHRALRELPLSLLEPLVTGLRRHADCLVPGRLSDDDGGGCAVGMMLREIAASPAWATQGPPAGASRKRSFWRPQKTIWERWPALAESHPRLAHIEIIFDTTCEEVLGRSEMRPAQVPRVVGLWMAAETQGEINVRHLEASASNAPARSAHLDHELFADTVARLRKLRPRLSEAEAEAVVESCVGVRRMDRDPLFVPSTWQRELELQEKRLSTASH